MTDKVPPQKIEQIVGAPRQESVHLAKWDLDSDTVYILHSRECLKREEDLRNCVYSLMLDFGLDSFYWNGWGDKTVVLATRQLTLVPLKDFYE